MSHLPGAPCIQASVGRPAITSASCCSSPPAAGAARGHPEIAEPRGGIADGLGIGAESVDPVALGLGVGEPGRAR